MDAVGWHGDGPEKLWRYNQHYFDDLNAAGSEDRSAWHRLLLVDWVKWNPPGRGDGWEPYPVSLRIVNWIKWALAGNDLPAECEHSLAVQARWLLQRLEIHLLGNHLFANAKALIFAGCYFEGAEAERWIKTGLAILRQQVPEQILDDGGHFERSTMYHALALEDMLDLCNIAEIFPEAFGVSQRQQIDEWHACIPAMLNWLLAMCHPDGGVGFFNDAAFGIAPDLGELLDYATRMQFSLPATVGGSRWLASSGYARLENERAVVLMDLAPIGPDYLPGHAHADTLSFELSLNGHRMIVNSGTSCYGTSAERLRQRGTAAHNTVVINGEDSSEVWGGFRVARRARILTRDVILLDEVKLAKGSHNGYARLPGRPIHAREINLWTDRCIVEDRIVGKYQSAIARFHIHPLLKMTQIGPHEGILEMPDGTGVKWSSQGDEAWIERSSWHPRFGESADTLCLCVRPSQGHSVVIWNWGQIL